MTTRILTGDCRSILSTLPENSIDCVVTSPPYFGLRDYGTAAWDGGHPECDHQAPNRQGQTGQRADRTFIATTPYQNACAKCGAIRIDSQIGLEASPQKYVAEMVVIFREVRRVLKKTGTLWLNLGDSYSGHNPPGWRDGNEKKNGGASNKNGIGYVAGLKSKDLVGIPWRVAFALQDDGWYLRQDIIWHKLNPMPESVRDRCTKAHEYLFLLSKSARYHYDGAAIAEKALQPVGDVSIASGRFSQHKQAAILQNQGATSTLGANHGLPTRNKRSVWSLVSRPFPGAHFATFPPKLVELCLKAGCPKGGTVMDPFGGAGTTGLVADRMGLHSVMIELNPDYAEMARWRLIDEAGMFAEVAAE